MGRWEAEKELSSASEDIYLDPVMNTRASKTLENEQMDYDSLLDMNQNPSVRDQEYLQHSSLWGHQYVSGGAGEGPHRVEPQVKSDATLPAYCTPPNPCPVGYSEEQGCTTTFENTAAFSREYQAMQECMCDGEHMFECPQEPRESARQMEPDLESYLAHQYQTSEHKNLVAKKFYHKKLVR